MAHADLAADGRIVVGTVWSEKELVRQVPGARWDPRVRAWHAPLSWASCVALRGVFGDRLTVGDRLNAWARDERVTRVDRALELRETLDTPNADHDPRLYPFQRAGVDFLHAAGSSLLADEMGTGKTVQVLTTLRELILLHDADKVHGPGDTLSPLPALVVCPNSVKLHWARHAADWLPEATPYVVEGSAAARRKTLAAAREDPAALVIVNLEAVRLFSRLAPYGSVRLARCRECDPRRGDENLPAARCEVHPKELNGFGFRVAVLDEAHRIKDPKSKQTRAVWATFHDPSLARRYALTGTPVVQNPADLWSIMHAVASEEYPVRSTFTDRYCLLSWNSFGGLDVVGTRPDTRAELFSFLDPRFRRVTKAQALPQLPPKVRSCRWVDMEPAQARMYRELHDQLVTRTQDGQLLVAASNLTAVTRLTQLASSSVAVEKPDPDDPSTWRVTLKTPSPKLDALEEVLAELGDAPCVVAAEHRQLVELAAARLEKLGISHALLTGAVAPVDRERALANLRAGRVRVLLFTVKAGGTGLDMSCVDTLVNLQRSWSLADCQQTDDRVHRIGSERHEVVRIIDVIARGTIEEDQVAAVHAKLARLDEITRDREKLRAAGLDAGELEREESRLLAEELLAVTAATKNTDELAEARA